MKILVQHAKHERTTGSVLGYTDVAEVNITELLPFANEIECLEYAYRWTNNIKGSWSIKKTSFPDPANGDRINGDYNEDVTVLAPRADGMGQRSTMIHDRMIVDGVTYKVAAAGFKKVVPENA
tara:strand:+ start:2894 stop:3262 length:369 start_codon:yes stop_codon:yes gene_type:complete